MEKLLYPLIRVVPLADVGEIVNAPAVVGEEDVVLVIINSCK